MSRHFLSTLFIPQSVVLFGVSEESDSIGGIAFKNLLEGGYKGTLYAISPTHKKVLEQTIYANLKEIAQPIDLAVIASPAQELPEILEHCGEHGIHSVILLTGGFIQAGKTRAKLAQSVFNIAKSYNIRFLGPDSLGLMRAHLGLNATFTQNRLKVGNLALVSQSGALCTAILDWAEVNDVGFSCVISLGDAIDISFGEILDYLASDPKTGSIILYIETLQQARNFMSGLRAAARMKPVIVLKSGRYDLDTLSGAHLTSSLLNKDAAFDAALQRAGVVRVENFGQVFATATTLVSRYQAYGSRLLILSNGVGPGIMAADRALDLRIHLAEMSGNNTASLKKIMPNQWNYRNPLNLLGDADVERYRSVLKIALQDQQIDGVLLILTPQAVTNPLEIAKAVVEIANQSHKPVLTCWMGKQQVQSSRDLFSQARLPDFRTPEAAVEAFGYLAAHHRNQKLLVQTPGSLGHLDAPDVEGAQIIIESVLTERRKVLSEMESKALLGAFQIPIIGTAIAKTPNEALVLAESFGFPVAMKINSPDIPHKSDVGGVRLNLSNAQSIRTTFNEITFEAKKRRPDARIDGVTVERMSRKRNGRELMVGMFRDAVFGPVITFGAGGVSVEIINDRAVALPPLNKYLANTLIDSTRIKKVLQEFRGMPPVNKDSLLNVLLRVSEMVCELPWLREIDINPLIVDEDGIVAVDARVVVDYYIPSADRYAHMAIYPYPSHLVNQWQLSDGSNIIIRPIRPEDAAIEHEFVKNLSDESKYFRFMQSIQELTPEMLIRFTQIDYDREMAFVAVTHIEGREIELGVARYTMNPDGLSCEFAIVIADEWQGQGFAHRLMSSLMDAARARGLQRMEGEVLSNNFGMLKLINKLGFMARVDPDDRTVTLVNRIL